MSPRRVGARVTLRRGGRVVHRIAAVHPSYFHGRTYWLGCDGEDTVYSTSRTAADVLPHRHRGKCPEACGLKLCDACWRTP